MKKTSTLFLIVSAFLVLNTVARAQKLSLDDPVVRSAYVQQLANQSRQAKIEAEAWAKARGIPIRYDDGRTVFELMYLEDGRGVYNMTHNVNAAISTATDLVRNTPPYDVNGNQLTVGIWDGGAVLSTHQEFGTRVTVMDGAASHYHSTHVGGTVGAAGVDPAALGMAPSIDIDSYEWNNDIAEMTGRAASYPGEPDKIYVSNHSYGHTSGWVWTTWATLPSYAWHWSSFAPWSGATSIEDNFGQYDTEAQSWDEIVYNAPYYLPFKSAGNDRSDNPSNGDTVYYSTDGGATWNSITYSVATCPQGDGVVRNGYDTIPHRGVAKNAITLGAVDDAVLSNSRYLPNATMAGFSGWGPADDGRIKPDIVANGIDVNSTDDDHNADYQPLSGTSMSTPNASGSAILLVEYYGVLFPGQAMLASTLKALIIHTADDLGNPGPDYSFGWGLMNTKTAAAHIKEQYENPATDMIVEGLLNDGNPSDSYVIESDCSAPIRATLCWTDPPGTSTSTHDDSTPKLVNDLDLRIISPGGSPTYYPYILNPASPSSNATTGDNTLDNVEQVYIDIPPVEGTYTVQVSHKGTLTDSQQQYSLILVEVPDIVSVDIKPQSCPNPLNVKSKGVLPVAILGSEDFDVNTIDTVSIELACVRPIRSDFEDVATPVSDEEECECTMDGPDGYTDLTLKFRTQEVVAALGAVNDGDILPLTLRGRLRGMFGGRPIEGIDCIRIIKKGRQNIAPIGLLRADLNSDGVINHLDLALLSNYWLKSYEFD